MSDMSYRSKLFLAFCFGLIMNDFIDIVQFVVTNHVIERALRR